MAIKKKRASDLGSKIDALYTAREERLKLGRLLDALKKLEDEAEEAVKAELSAQSLTGGKGTLASVTLVPKVVATPDPAHWADIFAWIAKTKHWELVRKQLNNAPYRELLAEKVQVPHTTSTTLVDLSIRVLR